MISILRETHETPPEIEALLTRMAGRNRFGEPNLRCVWGWNRLTPIGGKWEDHDAQGHFIREVCELRMEPKYEPDRWHFEFWLPPEKYGPPAHWYAMTITEETGYTIPELGHYPWRGDWEHVFTLETPKNEFVQLTYELALLVASRLNFNRQRKPKSLIEMRSQFIEKQDKRDHQFADAVLHDATPQYPGLHVTVA